MQICYRWTTLTSTTVQIYNIEDKSPNVEVSVRWIQLQSCLETLGSLELCFGLAVYVIRILSNLTCLWGLSEEVWCTMWREIASTGCSRFIILIRRSDFPLCSIPPPVDDAQQMIYPTRKKSLKAFTWVPEEICDFGFNLPNSGKPG